MDKIFKFKLAAVNHREFLKEPTKGQRTPVGVRYALISVETGEVIAHTKALPSNSAMVPFVPWCIVPLKVENMPVAGGYTIKADTVDHLIHQMENLFYLSRSNRKTLTELFNSDKSSDTDKHARQHKKYATGRLAGLSNTQRDARFEFFERAIRKYTYVPEVDEKDFRIIVFTKKHGRERIVYAPSERVKAALERPLQELNDIQTRILSRAVSGFVPGRNIAYAAWKHVGKQFTLSADLSDFFDHVTPGMCIKAVKDAGDDIAKKFNKIINRSSAVIPEVTINKLMFPDGKARQGLPTSPALANIAAAPLDKKIQQEWSTVVYTRYADDLAFSCDDEEILQDIRERLPAMIESFGLKANPRKWKLQSARGGRRIITGISVGEDDIRLPRRYRKALRPVVHQNRRPSRTRGMLAWQNYVNDYTPLEEFQDLEL